MPNGNLSYNTQKEDYINGNSRTKGKMHRIVQPVYSRQKEKGNSMRAKLIHKQPYTNNYGSGVEYTFEAKEIGQYKTKKTMDDNKYQWLQFLPVGAVVELAPNSRGGKGYFINEIKDQPSSQPTQPGPTQAEQVKEVFYGTVVGNIPVDNADNKEQIFKNIDIMVEGFKYLKDSIGGIDLGLTNEDMRAIVISAMIQSGKSKQG